MKINTTNNVNIINSNKKCEDLLGEVIFSTASRAEVSPNLQSDCLNILGSYTAKNLITKKSAFSVCPKYFNIFNKSERLNRLNKYEYFDNEEKSNILEKVNKSEKSDKFEYLKSSCKSIKSGKSNLNMDNHNSYMSINNYTPLNAIKTHQQESTISQYSMVTPIKYEIINNRTT